VSAPSPRLAPLTAAGWPEEGRELLRGHLAVADQYLSGAADAPPMPGILGVLGHHPRLAGNWLALNGGLLDDPVLDPRVRELLVLRVGWRTRCRYEWAQHTRIAAGAGVTAEEIAAMADGPPPAGWSDRERDLLSAVDQMIDAHRIDDETWDRLAGHFDERELLELLFVIGSYLCLALVLNSVDLQPDPDEHGEHSELPGVEG
jgi:AhpD family alkylhydroperoxidase